MKKQLVIVKVYDEIITKPPKNGKKKEMVKFKLHNETIQQQEMDIQQSYILKQTWWCLSVCGDKQGRVGRPGQPLRGVGRGAISIKEILGENRGTCI
jgi:hypothetical protein